MKDGQPASLVGEISDAELTSRTPGKSVFGAIVENESGAVRILFFNQPFRADKLKLGTRVMVSGTAKLNGLRMEFVHPQITLIDGDDDMEEPAILPVYPLTQGIKQTEMRKTVAVVTDQLLGSLVEVMPESIRKSAAERLSAAGIEVGSCLPEINVAIANLHAPPGESELLAARTRLVFQELYVMQLALAIKRRRLTTDLNAPPLESTAMIDARIVNRFGFPLTGDQRSRD